MAEKLLRTIYSTIMYFKNVLSQRERWVRYLESNNGEKYK